jgi:hypothetical protein
VRHGWLAALSLAEPVLRAWRLAEELAMKLVEEWPADSASAQPAEPLSAQELDVAAQVERPPVPAAKPPPLAQQGALRPEAQERAPGRRELG